MKQALLYSPYLDTAGGGEKYLLAVAYSLEQQDYRVHLASNHADALKKLQQRHNIQLNKTTVNSNFFQAVTGSLIQKRNLMRKYDLAFFVSDGSIPLMFAHKNLLHFQVPFHHVNGGSISNQLKLKTIHQIICNSQFTKQHIDQEFSCNSKVVYPPANQFQPDSKKKYILSVGRFDNTLHSKRHDILVKAFKQLNQPDWSLHLVGGVLHGQEQVKALKQQAEGSNIRIHTNVSFAKLKEYYAHASLYWHAAGFGLEVEKHPEKAEHFGITTVEAMSAGAIPLVYQAGGQTEIVTHQHNGYLWSTTEQLIKLSQKLIKNPKLRTQLQPAAIKSSKKYNLEEFVKHFHQYTS